MRTTLLPVFFFLNVAVFAADPIAERPKMTSDLPPASETEVWSPIPAVVSVAAGGAPSDAVVLFDGKNLDSWQPVTTSPTSWKIADGVMFSEPKAGYLRTKAGFGDVQLHLEFRTPAEVKGNSQGRGNSGVFLMGLYEVQILDSYNNPTYVNGQVGAVYKQHIPLVNPSRPPGEWQTYEIVFVAPRFSDDGKLLKPARITAFLNGVLVQHDVVLAGPTSNRGRMPYTAHAAKLPLQLQDHGNPVGFRNIWVRELTLPEGK